MQLLFLACHGDAGGVEALLRGGVDVNSINLDGRTALHIAACEGQRDVVDVLLDWQANIDARDRWGSTVSDQNFHQMLPRNQMTDILIGFSDHM
jgi:ankyrin repeat protein